MPPYVKSRKRCTTYQSHTCKLCYLLISFKKSWTADFHKNNTCKTYILTILRDYKWRWITIKYSHNGIKRTAWLETLTSGSNNAKILLFRK